MDKIIIGIHGLGNKPDSKTLKMWWLASIRDGLATTDRTKMDIPFELAYWANLLHEEPLDPAITDDNHALYVEDPYLPQVKSKSELLSPFKKKLIDYLGDQLEDIFLNEDLSINFSSVTDFIIGKFFKDLAVYYRTDKKGNNSSVPHKKQEIRDALADVLLKHRKKQILLIAHSMGALIAYDVLTSLGDQVTVDTLVTIGSPLGLPVIRSKIASEHSKSDDPKTSLQTPECVKSHWYNLYDYKDKIALFHNLAEDYRANSRGVSVVDISVANGYRQLDGDENPHKSYGYLRTPELSDIVGTFFEESPRKFLNKLRVKLRKWLKH